MRDPGTVTAGDAIVGGLSAADEGRSRALAAADAIRRASPLTDLRPLRDEAADLVVLARPWAASDPLAAAVQAGQVPHLVATVRGETGVVGPLVVPGRTSCLRCADLHRRDADPRWPRLAVQLGDRAAAQRRNRHLPAHRRHGGLQVLAYLDGTAAPITLDATVELRPPDTPAARPAVVTAPRLRLRPRGENTPGQPATRPGEYGGILHAERPRQGTMGG